MSEKTQQDARQKRSDKTAEPGTEPQPAGGAAYPLLALQRTIGNRRVGRLLQRRQMMVQRDPLPARSVRGVNLGHFEIVATEGVLPMVGTTEVVQAGDRAGTFRGFPTRYEALSLALLQNGYTAIVRDPGGQFHVLNVAESSPVEDEVRSVPNRSVAGFTVLRFVNPLIPTPASVIHGEMPMRPEDTWAGRVARAQELRTNYYSRGQTGLQGQMADAFRSLAADAFNVPPSEINILFRSRDTSSPDRINIMLDPSVEAGGTSGIGQRALPPGQAAPPFGLRPGESAAQQRPFLWVSADSFDASGPDRARAVLRHEASHSGTTERVRELMETWQGQGEPAGDFWAWLQQQRRLRNGGPHQVTQADMQLALARLYQQSDEPLACAARFTAEYHHVPAGQINEDTFGEVRYMLANWVSAGEGMPGRGVPPLRDEAMRRLRVYYREELDAAHRTAFDGWVDGLPAGGDERILFPHLPARGYARWGERSVQAAIGQMRAFRRGAR